MLDTILDADESACPDFSHHQPSGDKSLLRTGLGMFGGMMGIKKQKLPCQNPLIVLVAVGGITCSELRSIKVCLLVRP